MMARLRIASGSVALCLVLLASGARADDTDIYVSGTVPEGSEPLVMFSLDYRPNLAATACQGGSCDYLIAGGYLAPAASYTFFDVLRAVLKRVMKPLEGVKVGLMINHDHRNNCANKVQANCSNGGYIARGFEAFLADDGNGSKAEFHNILAAIPTPQGNQSHSYQGKELFFEFYRYLSGQGVYNGHVGFTDFSSPGNTNLERLGQDHREPCADRLPDSDQSSRVVLQDFHRQPDVPGVQPGGGFGHGDQESGCRRGHGPLREHDYISAGDPVAA